MAATFSERLRIHTWLWFGEGFLIALSASLCLLPLIAWLLLPGWTGWLAAALTLPSPLMGWSIARQAFSRRDDDEAPGIELQANAVPALATAVEQVRTRLGAPMPDAVYLDEGFNASIRQRASLFGRPHNVLVLGLPLLETLDTTACTAVLAHEFAHIAQRHGRYSSRLYFARERWRALGERTEKHIGLAHAPLRLFVAWYVPRLLQLSFAFARSCEYQADAEAAQACGSIPVAQALIGLRIQSRALRRVFWPQRYAAADSGHFVELARGQALAEPLDRAQACTWLHDALDEEADEHSTHPSLAQRLQALAVDSDAQHAPIAWQRPPASAAQQWLGAEHQALAQAMDERCAEQFQQRHAQASQRRRAQRGEVHGLLSKRALRALSVDEMARLAWLEDCLQVPAEERGPWLEQGLAMAQEHHWLMFQHAQKLQEQGDFASAATYWQPLAEQPGYYQVSALHHMAEQALRGQDWAAAQALRAQADSLVQQSEQAPSYEHHGLSASQLQRLSDTLAPLLSQAEGVWLLRETGANQHLLLIKPPSTALSRLLQRITGEAHYERQYCQVALDRVLPRVDLPLEALMLDAFDPMLEHCDARCALHDQG
ncbi:M48 family metallopeptidase [Pseudomonas xanthosomatis]|uniref:M48 family metallopeptidase n=1 Tax=Pseudomonas xanthosomatis TaxID=2842356 RepID=UPI003515C99E